MAGRPPWRRAVALALAGALLVALAWSWWRAGGEPEHWASFQTRHEALAPAQRQRLADQAEHRVLRWWSGGEHVTPTSGPPEDEAEPAPSTLELDYELINTWLNERGGAWLDQQGGARPRGLEALAVAPTDNPHELLVAASIEPLGGRIVSARLRLDDDEHNHAHVTLSASGLRLGRLRVPAAVVLAGIGDSGLGQGVADLLTGGLSFEPVWRVDETRQARLLEVEVREHELVVTLRHEVAAQPSEP